MLPAGIISSGGELFAEDDGTVPGIDDGTAEDGDDGADKTGMVGIIAGKVGATLFVPVRARCGRRRMVARFVALTVGNAGGVCAQRSRPVKNKIRTSVVVFILQSWLRIWNWF